MAYDGTLKFDTSMDASGFQKGAGRLGDIVKGSGIFKIIEMGMRAVVSSIDAAISRYDTLNKFPKIMEQMGYGGEVAEKSIQRLSDGIQGLPTTLDEIVGNTRQFTVALGDLDKGTDSALAVNNAFLASGAASEAASRGTVQYLQMLSSGKVDMMSWRTLNETMTYALQKTAESFGYAGASAKGDLYAALQSGEITMQQFNAKIVELNNGVGGFAEVAKTATGGIGTAWTNLKTGIVRSTANIITAIDKGLSGTRFKSIENIIATASKGINAALAGVAKAAGVLVENIEVVIPAVIGFGVAWKGIQLLSYMDKLNSLSAALKKMSPAIVTATAAKIKDTAATIAGAAAELKHVAVITAANIAKRAATVAEKASTAATTGGIAAKLAAAVAAKVAAAAQWVWNAALSANPIGLIIVAIAALIAGIIALVSWLGKSDKAYQDGKQYVEDYAAANEEAAAKVDETADSFNDNTSAAEANAEVSRKMLADLQALADKGLGRTAEETYELQAKINALNAAQEGLNLTIDETTGGLSMTTAQIESYIDATANAARTTALENHMKDLQEQLVGVESQFIDAERQIAEWEAQVQNGELSTAKQEKLVADLEKEMEKLEETQAEITDEMIQNEEDYTAQLERQEQERKALVAMQEDDIRAFAEEHHLSYEQIKADMDENKWTFSDWQTENAKVLGKGQEDIAKFAEKWGLSTTDVNTAIAASGLSIEDYVTRQDEALEHAKEVVADYTNTTTNGFSVMEQESAISLGKFMENMRQNQEATANWATNMNTLMELGINQGLIRQLSEMGPEGAAQAQKFVDELTAMNGGVDLALGQTNEAVAAKLAEIDGTFNTGLDNMQIAADTQLRAEAYYASGYAPGDNIAAAIKENPAATDAATQMGKDVANAAVTSAESADFTAVGQTLGGTLVAGLQGAIQVGAGNVTAAISGMSVSVQTALRTMSMQCQSIAIQMMTGINTAIVTRTATVKVSAAAVASGIVTSLRPIISGATSAANAMMAGILSAMNNKAGDLYNKAAEIANNISETLRAAWDVNSPSRVTMSIAESVMEGLYLGMDGKSAMLYREAEDIAGGIAERLSISPDVLNTAYKRLEAMTAANPLHHLPATPRTDGTNQAGAVSYSTNLTQNVTTPKPLSASELTREGQDLLRRSRWQLP